MTLFSALALQLSAPPSATPFFTNDIVGLVKIILVFGSMVGTTIGIIVKLTQSKYASDLTNLGEKVDTMQKEFASFTAERSRDAITLAQHTIEIGNLREGFGSIRASLSALQASGAELHRDITNAITESAARIQSNVQDLRIEVTKLQERDRVGELLERIVENRRDDR
jgi:hypothetical protein